MNEYKYNFRLLQNWMISNDLSIRDCQVLLAYMCSILDSRRAWTDAETPEQMALAAQSRDNAIYELYQFIHQYDVPETVMMAIIYLTTHNY